VLFYLLHGSLVQSVRIVAWGRRGKHDMPGRFLNLELPKPVLRRAKRVYGRGWVVNDLADHNIERHVLLQS
jgi:hypothetical protein